MANHPVQRRFVKRFWIVSIWPTKQLFVHMCLSRSVTHVAFTMSEWKLLKTSCHLSCKQSVEKCVGLVLRSPKRVHLGKRAPPPWEINHIGKYNYVFFMIYVIICTICVWFLITNILASTTTTNRKSNKVVIELFDRLIRY